MEVIKLENRFYKYRNNNISVDELSMGISGNVIPCIDEAILKQVQKGKYRTISRMIVNMLAEELPIDKIISADNSEVEYLLEKRRTTFHAKGIMNGDLYTFSFSALTEMPGQAFKEWVTKHDFKHIMYNGINFSRSMGRGWTETVFDWKFDVEKAFDLLIEGKNKEARNILSDLKG